MEEFSFCYHLQLQFGSYVLSQALMQWSFDQETLGHQQRMEGLHFPSRGIFQPRFPKVFQDLTSL